MLCLSGFELYSRWVPLKCRMFEIAVMQSMTSMYMSRLAETSHTGRFDHARLPLWSGGLETLYTIFFPFNFSREAHEKYTP